MKVAESGQPNQMQQMMDTEKQDHSLIKQWKIINNVINYVQYTGNPIYYYKWHVKALEPSNHKRKCETLKEEDKHVIDLYFVKHLKN